MTTAPSSQGTSWGRGLIIFASMGRRGADLPVCGTLPIYLPTLRRRDIVPNSQPPPITLLIPTPEQANARRQRRRADKFLPKIAGGGHTYGCGDAPGQSAGISRVISDPGDRADGRFHLFPCASRIQDAVVRGCLTISLIL